MRVPDPEEIMRQMDEMGLGEEVRKMLEEASALPIPEPADPPSELFIAVQRQDLDRVKRCLEAGADPNEVRRAPFEEPKTPLKLAVSLGDPTIVQTLIDNGADARYVTEHGYTALIDACHGRNIRADEHLMELVNVLLDAGADPNLTSSYGESALSVLSHVGRFDVVDLMLRRGADGAILGWGALSRAVTMGTIDDVRRELSQTSDLEEKDWWERTPFLLALAARDRAKAELLLQSGADIAACGRCGSPALNFAIDSRDLGIVRWLLSMNVDLSARDEFGHGPLDWAAEAGDASILSLILDKLKSDADYADLVDCALERANNGPVAMALLSAGADPQRLDVETRCAVLGHEYMGETAWANVSKEDFESGRDPRFGKSNPELASEPFWEAMIRTRASGYAGSIRFEERSYSCGEARPVWCAYRFGQSLTFMPDGRVIEIGGEHEDWYDPDFCIYNDVIVHEIDGSVKTYIYPREDFPCTDFHTATLIGDAIYIVGGLRYEKDRGTSVDVFKLDTKTLRIDRIKASGDVPPYICRHKAVQRDGSVVISGGDIYTSHDSRPNTQTFSLDVASLVWSQG